MAGLRLEHIYKVYPNGTKAVSDFTMDIQDKEFIVFVGPSGCGKSTTLRMIAGLEEISAGELYIDNNIVNDVEPKDRDIAMVFQNYALYPHMTVYENIAFGLKLRHLPNEEIHKKVLWAAQVLDLTEYLDRKPRAMSGGQRQRVSLGRAIIRNPKVMLLDEPLSNLDAKLRAQMRSEIAKLHEDLQTTFIYVTHDQVEAMTLGTRVVVMKLGKIMQVDTPKNLYDYPDNLFVAGFIGTPQMNYFKGMLNVNDGKYSVTVADLTVELSEEKQERLRTNNVEAQEVTVGVRPDHILISENGIPAHVDVAELMGTSYHLHLSALSKDVIAIIPNDGNFTSYFDKDLNLSFEGNHVHVFALDNDRNLEFINEEVAASYPEATVEQAPAVEAEVEAKADAEVVDSEPVIADAEVVDSEPVIALSEVENTQPEEKALEEEKQE